MFGACMLGRGGGRGGERRLPSARLPARLLAVLAALASACGDDAPTSAPSDSTPTREIRASTDSLGILPFRSKMLDFVLVDKDGTAVPDRIMTFVIDGRGNTPPAEVARGANLSHDRAVTDHLGRVRLQVLAGEATYFSLRVRAPRAADLVLTVFVDEKRRGPVEVFPRLQTTAEVATTIASIRLHFLTGVLCATVPRARPMPGAIPPREIEPGTVSVF